MRTVQEIANDLNGTYLDGSGITVDIIQECCANKMMILYPYSDDCLEVRGHINDEYGAYNGGKFKYLKEGDFYIYEDHWDPDEVLYKKATYNMLANDKDEYDFNMRWVGDTITEDRNLYWIIETNFEHATFNLVDDNESTWAKCLVVQVP